MKRVLVFILFLISTVIIVAIATVGSVYLDLWINPWIKDAIVGWRWWNYFTTPHTATVLYLKYGVFYL